MATPIAANTARLTAAEAAEATGGRVVRTGRETRAARGITSDSRAAAPGAAFVALRGETHDGHDYVRRAIDAGVVLVIVEKGRASAADGPTPVDVVEVDDTLTAWGDLARAHIREWRKQRSDAVIFAITGSAGKTTTKELCAALLRPVGVCHAAPGNLNNRVGVPAVAFGLSPEHRFAVFEAGMSLRGEIAALARIIQPDVAVITNIGMAHAEGVGGSLADVAREKGDLLLALSETAVAVAPREDQAAVLQLARTPARRRLTFGTTPTADYRLIERKAAGLDGSEVRITRSAGPIDVRLPLVGEAAALDLLAALAATESVTGPRDGDALTRALRCHLPTLTGRMQARRLASGTTLLDDSYNANPSSVRAALKTLAEVARGRRAIVILGEMRELGPDAAKEHAALGAAVADSGAKALLSLGGFAHLAVQGAERAGVACARAESTEEGLRLAVALVRSGDVVLVKASRSVGAERVVQALERAGGGAINAPEDTR